MTQILDELLERLRGAQRIAVGVEVNLNPTYLSELFDARLQGPAGVVLPALVAQAWPDAASF